MMSNNKILTVSYGTFSCTLEGFEDSFGTMKAIAEYFRDLAADDRYFGAEPPQPDADMLAKIAEREIARRVEAHSSDNGIHLRAGAAAAALTAADAVVAQPEAPQTQGVEDTSPEAAPVEAPVQEVPVSEPEVGETPVAEDVKEDAPEVEDIIAATVEDQPEAEPSVSETPMEETIETDEPVDEISELVAQTASEEVSEPEAELPAADVEDGVAANDEADEKADDEVEDVVAEDASETATEDSIAAFMALGDASADSAIEEDAELDADFEADDDQEPARLDGIMHANMGYDMTTLHDASKDDASKDDASKDDASKDDASNAEDVQEDIVADIVEDAPVEPAAPANSIAAKLQRIRDVVSKTRLIASDVSDDDYVQEVLEEQDRASKAGSDEDDSHAAAPADDQIEDLDTKDEAFENAQADASVDAEDDIVAMLADFEADDAGADFDEDEDVMSSEEEDASEDEIGLDDIDMSSLFADSDDDSDAGDDETAFPDLYEDGGEQATSASDDADDPVPSPLRARVIKVKKADLDAAIEDGALEELASDLADDEDDSDEAPIDSSLSLDEEDDLLRELAAVEAEFEADSDDADIDSADEDDAEIAPSFAQDEDDIEADIVADASAARLLEEISGTEENELDRLMAEADTHMEEPEGSNRRSAFDQLRGAVEATKADEELGKAPGVEAEADYRTDLEAAVRPRRPVADGQARSERPAGRRPAPLKLVAEQRIDDIDASTSTGPVRPRRVGSEIGGEDDGNFSDYAAACGARELPELLEAAASYMSFVEGRKQFSRPQLMKKVRQMQDGGFSREDGLRHFGQLLRVGKIEKLEGGRFTVSDEIGFRPEDKRAVG